MKYYVVKIKTHREWNPAMLVRMQPRLVPSYLEVLQGKARRLRGRIGIGNIKDSAIALASAEDLKQFEGHYEFDGYQLKFVPHV